MLYPTDFSPYSKGVFNYLKDLKKFGVKEIGVLHVINISKFDKPISSYDISSLIEKEIEYTREEYEKHKEIFEKAGFKVNLIQPAVGDPVVEIVKKSESYNFIGMTSRGYGVLREIVLGSVSEGVVRKSRIPVLLFKFKVKIDKDLVFCSKYHEELLDRILVAYDFSKTADKALEYAINLAKSIESEIHVVYVKEEDRKLSEIEDRLKGTKYSLYERIGVPHKEILALIDEIDATIVFMGSSRMGLFPAILGSTSEILIRRTKVPTLVVRC
ncbi:MAG: universal stress protein [Archaeoglobaceae archaeon]|nr:universal stress protein [Archaeoglobaceae archaeon]MDW8014094.1 universal stress protein [Archaeoglobaceae archaeon]